MVAKLQVETAIPAWHALKPLKPLLLHLFRATSEISFVGIWGRKWSMQLQGIRMKTRYSINSRDNVLVLPSEFILFLFPLLVRLFLGRE